MPSERGFQEFGDAEAPLRLRGFCSVHGEDSLAGACCDCLTDAVAERDALVEALREGFNAALCRVSPFPDERNLLPQWIKDTRSLLAKYDKESSDAD